MATIDGTSASEEHIGTDDDDTINGNGGVDRFRPGAGNDVSNGGSSFDFFFNSDGIDISYGNDGDDRFIYWTLDGQVLDNETYIGGGGIDLLSLTVFSNIPTVDYVFDARPDAQGFGRGTYQLRFREIELFDLSFSSNDDTAFLGTGDDRARLGLGDDFASGRGGDDELVGSFGNDRLIGGLGNDRLEGDQSGAWTSFSTDLDDMLSGGAGDDLLIGGPGRNRLDGGAGIDTASYADATQGVQVNLATGQALSQTSSGRQFLDDTLVNIENVVATVYADFLSGDANDNALDGGSGRDELQGGGGNDRLDGANGDDRLFGEAGDDTLLPGTGDDIVDGGAGFDIVDYRSFGSTLTVDLRSSLAQTVSAAAGNDALIDVEGVIGGRGGDTIFGSRGDDLLDGYHGNDFVYGLAGNDRIIGGDNRDTLRGNDGDDTLEGGAGRDVLGGGAGRDLFVYADIGHTALRDADLVQDFTVGEDRIDLSAVGADATGDAVVFAFVGTDGFDAANQIRIVEYAPRDWTLLYINTDADNAPEARITLNGILSLTEADFIL